MKKEYIDFNKLTNSDLIYTSSDTGTRVYDAGDDVIKLFNPLYNALCMMNGIDIKGKILASDNFDKEQIKEIVLPKSICYDEERRKKFGGYKMPKIVGVDYPTYSYNNPLTCDLNYYANMHSKFEDIVKRGNEQGIIFPDLCTCKNIIITPNKEVRFIDYDDFQVGNLKTNCYSDVFGSDEIMESLGIMDKNGLFNINADKLSLIILYFLDALNIELLPCELIKTRKDGGTSLDELFEIMRLDDLDIQHKVWKAFQKNEQNEFLGDDLYRMAEMYTIELCDEGNDVVRKLKRR